MDLMSLWQMIGPGGTGGHSDPPWGERPYAKGRGCASLPRIHQAHVLTRPDCTPPARHANGAELQWTSTLQPPATTVSQCPTMCFLFEDLAREATGLAVDNREKTARGFFSDSRAAGVRQSPAMEPTRGRSILVFIAYAVSASASRAQEAPNVSPLITHGLQNR